MDGMTKRGHPPTGYYTATQAKKRLGDISDGMLRSYVEKGKIYKLKPPGRTQGFYKREDVDKLVRILDEFFDEPDQPGPEFLQATQEDIPELVDFLIEVFGGPNTLEKRLQWYDKNPETAFMLRNKGKIVGCVYVLPLTLQKIEMILSDSTPGSTRLITENDIQPYTPDDPAYLYIVSLGVKPGTSNIAKRARGQTVIRGLIRFLVSLGERGIHVQMIAARTDSRDGIHLLKHAGFTEIESSTQSRNFIIEVDRSGVPLIMPYKIAFREQKTGTNHYAFPFYLEGVPDTLRNK
jgi:hypothetical protein